MTAPALTRYTQGQASVSADNLNTFEQTCTNVAQLRQLTGTEGMQVYIRGYVTPNDGGSGPFYWSPTATGPDNGTSVIVPIGSATGAWLRLPVVAGSAASFATTALLLNAFGVSITLADGVIFVTAGRNTEGDGGGGTFYYDASDTTTPDNGGTIRVDPAGRRWKALIGSALINVAMFGAFPSNPDNSPAINAAFAAGAVIGRDVQLQGTYLCNSTLTFDISKTSLDMNGGILDFVNLTSAVAIVPFTTQTDPNFQARQHNAHPFRNGNILGPNLAKTCFQPTALIISGNPWITGMIYEKIGITGFDVGYACGDGEVSLTFRDCTFGSTARGSNVAFQIVGSNNAGENMVFDHCFVVNINCFILNSSGTPNFDIYCISCSADGLHYISTGGTPSALGVSAGQHRVVWLGGHWEPSYFDQYLVWTGIAGTFLAYGTEFVVSPPSHVPFRSDGTQVDAGIILDRIAIFSSSEWPRGIICDGTGNFEISSNGNGNTFVTNGAYANNRIPNNTFPSNPAGVWGGTFVYDTGSPPAGATGDILLNNTHVNATYSTPIFPGQKAAAAWQLKLALGAGDTFIVQIGYFDKAGNLLVLNSPTYSSNIPAYQPQTFVIQILAPPGTASAQLLFQYNPSAGGGTCQIGLPYFIID